MRTSLLGLAAFAALAWAPACGTVTSLDNDARTIDAPPPLDADTRTAHLMIDRDSADLGMVVVGDTSAAATFTIQNTGDGDSGRLMVTVSGDGYATTMDMCNNTTLAAGARCSVGVTVTPTAAGPDQGTLTVKATPGGMVTASLTANALAPGALVFMPDTFDYGTVVAGASSPPKTFTLKNTGGAATGNIAVMLGGADAGSFRITSNGCAGMALAPNGTCDVAVSMNLVATDTGPKAANLVAMATPGGAAMVTLSGTAQTPATISIGGSGAFGDVLLGATATKVLTVTNGGQQATGTLTISRNGNAAFSFAAMAGDCVSGTTTLAGGASCTLHVVFTPTASGQVSGMVTVSANPGGSQTAMLTGNGQRPATLSANTNQLMFGPVEVGALSGGMNWTITNTGDVPSSVPVLALNSMELDTSGGNTCTAALQPGGMCTVTLKFKPSTGGARTAMPTLSVMGSMASLTASATGMWRVTVQRLGNAGTITSNPAGLNCPGTCSALFAPGDITIQARTTNGSQVYFSAWSGASAGTCATSPNRDCVLTVDGTESLTATFSPLTSNLIFISSATYATDLGGVGPYDAACNTLATQAGINNAAGTNFIAWISIANSMASSRLGAAAPAQGWVRMDGRVFATSLNSLYGNQVLNPIRYSETGADLSDSNVLTGTNSDGTLAANCNGWTSTAAAVSVSYGSSSGGPSAWTGDSGSTCSNVSPGRLICMMKQFTAAPAIATFPGKKVWMTNAPFSVSATNSPDTACNTDRPAGVASGRALIARTTAAASSLLTAAQMYVRPDGQEVGTGAELAANLSRGGIWQAGNGAYVSASDSHGWVWTGSLAIDQVGTVASTCGNWADNSQAAGRLGAATRSRALFWSLGTETCSPTQGNVPRLYCYEP
ncbi:MAG TPA: choice-of-anchor D domain-containing protein [Kofleriaceae bacterium]|nr:choice-of-anchor D domain-containing protein [Kofleriaceae bacterium]